MDIDPFRRPCCALILAFSLTAICRAGEAPAKDANPLIAIDSPRRIDLDADGETVDSVLGRIKKHFGYGVMTLEGTGGRKVTLALKGATMFEAIEAVRKAAGLSYDFDDNKIRQKHFKMRDRDDDAEPEDLFAFNINKAEAALPAAAKGPFILYFVNIDCSHTHFSSLSEPENKGDGGKEQCSLRAQLLVEPGVNFSGIGMREVEGSEAKTVRMTDSKVSMDDHDHGSRGVREAQNFMCSVTLTGDTATATTLDWRAVVYLQVPLKFDEKRFDNLSEIVGKKQQALGGSFTIKKLEDKRIEYIADGGLVDLGTDRPFDARFPSRNAPIDKHAILANGPSSSSGVLILDDQGAKPNATSKSYGVSSSGKNAPPIYHGEFTFKTVPSTIIFRKPTEAAMREFVIEIPKVPVP